MFVVTSAQMRQIEDRCFALGMPVAALMEKAALRMSAHFEQLYPKNIFRRCGILVGPGHNGGDALVIARELLLQGRQVIVWTANENLKDLTRAHFQYFRGLGGLLATEVQELSGCDVLVDGLFGYGLDRPLSGKWEAAVSWMNDQNLPKVAIDLPSGLATDTGHVLGTAVRASTTLCLGFWKRASLCEEAREYLGQEILVDIGLGPLINEMAPSLGMLPFTLETEKTFQLLPWNRSPIAHKYKTGKALILAGSAKYPGAGLLALSGCRAVGPGYVVMGCSDHLRDILVGSAPDVVFSQNWKETDSLLSGFDAILCGSGFTEAEQALPELLAHPAPLVLDAEAFVALKNHIGWPFRFEKTVILTPHAGEFRRIFSNLSLESDRARAASEAAALVNAVVVLKGARTIIAHPDGRTAVLMSSTPALARAGTGDVLAGLIAGIMSQHTDAFSAACAGVALHAHAASALEQQRSVFGVEPQRLAESIAHVLARFYDRTRTPSEAFL